MSTSVVDTPEEIVKKEATKTQSALLQGTSSALEERERLSIYPRAFMMTLEFIQIYP